MNQIRKAIGSFIWAKKSARINRKTLYRLKKDGGLALPDISLYLRSIFITRIVDWFHNMDNKQWVKLEEEVTDIKLKSLPWIKREYRPREGDMPFLVVSTLKVWDDLIKRGIGSTLRGPMTPLFSNPEFPLAFKAKTFLKWQRRDDTRIVEIMEENKLPPLEALGTEYRKKWFQHGQLQQYISSLTKESIMNRPLLGLEKILLQKHRPTHILSVVYKYLISENKEEGLQYIKKWEEELGMVIPRAKWEKAITVTHKLSISTRHQERNYKILARWYKCPVDMNKINSDNTDRCWRCEVAKGSMSHIWYFCPEIQAFWEKVFKIYRATTGVKIQSDIYVAILSMIPGSIKNIKKGTLKYYITAARTVIARNWKNKKAPSIKEWECEMGVMRSLEERMILEGRR